MLYVIYANAILLYYEENNNYDIAGWRDSATVSELASYSEDPGSNLDDGKKIREWS